MSASASDNYVRSYLEYLWWAVAWLIARVQYAILGVAFISVKWFGATGNGVTDDTAALQRAVTALTGTTGVSLWFPNGSYLVSAPVVFPSGGITIWGSPKAIIKAAITGGGIANSAFYAPAPVAIQTTTLSAATTPGSEVIGVTSATGFVVGAYVQIVDTNSTFTGQIDNVAGTVVTLDRSVTHVFAMGATINVIASQPVVLTLHGNNMQFTGQAVGMITGCFWESIIEDVILSGTTGGNGDVFIALNYGSAMSTVRDSQGDAVGHGVAYNAGFAMVGCDLCLLDNCTFRNGGAGASAIKISDSSNCVAQNCSGYGCNLGAVFGTDSASGTGCTNCTVVGGAYQANASNGIQVSNGSTGCLIDKVSCLSNGGSGIALNGTGTAMADNVIGTVTSSNNTGNGIEIDAGAKRTYIVSAITDTNTQAGIGAADEVWIGFHECLSNTAAATSCLASTGTGRVVVESFEYSLTAHATFAVSTTAAGRVDMSNGQVTLNTNSFAFDAAAAGSLITSENVVVGIVGGATGTSGWYGVSGTVRIGAGCDASATATPINTSGGLTVNRKQTWIASGSSVVNVAWPDIKATDVVEIQAQTIGGVPGVPIYAITPGVHISFTSQASDTTTYEYYVT